MQKSLLIVHASDFWLNSYMSSVDAINLKNKIRERINQYLLQWLKVIYTPYFTNETFLPIYFPTSKLISNINISEIWLNIPLLKKIKFEVIATLDLLNQDWVDSIEIWWVQYYACVRWTKNAFDSITGEDIQEYITCNPSKSTERLKKSLEKNIKSYINWDITDYK